jgi:hypothetical protein
MIGVVKNVNAASQKRGGLAWMEKRHSSKTLRRWESLDRISRSITVLIMGVNVQGCSRKGAPELPRHQFGVGAAARLPL